MKDLTEIKTVTATEQRQKQSLRRPGKETEAVTVTEASRSSDSD